MPNPRNLPPDQEGIFHIYNRGNNGSEIFLDEDDFLIFFKIIQQAKAKFGINIFHYCVLINHYHLIIRATGAALAKAMQWINYGYSMSHAKKYSRRGGLWQGRYRSETIDSEEYLSVCNGYVELNAIKHNIVDAPEQYPWSSYHYYAFGKDDPIVDVDPDFLDLAQTNLERQSIYREISKVRMSSLKCLYQEDDSTDGQCME